jgi:ribosome-associated toxin RatA of RatAB toxin-antitoxin module
MWSYATVIEIWIAYEQVENIYIVAMETHANHRLKKAVKAFGRRSYGIISHDAP